MLHRTTLIAAAVCAFSSATCAAPALSSNAKTTALAATTGWSRVTMPSAGLRFSIPTPDAGALAEFDAFPAFAEFLGAGQPEKQVFKLRYQKYAAARHGAVTQTFR